MATTPASGNLLTCGTVSANVMGATDPVVTWTTDPAGLGAPKAPGIYGAPIQRPSPAAFTLVATAKADPAAKASGMFTLGTAFPHAAATITGSSSDGQSFGVFPHWTAARGMRVYQIWPLHTGTSVKLMLVRSDDGGTTWAAANAAISATTTDATTGIECGAVAIDAGDPDVVYAIARIGGSSDLASSVGADGPTLALGVSTDGGATFTTRVMQAGATAGGPNGLGSVGVCGDVASPAPSTVVVESPGAYDGGAQPDIAIWSDDMKGAGFASGTAQSNDYVANGYRTSLANVNGMPAATRLVIAQDGGSVGGATESPRLFTDGAGELCITYVGTVDGATPVTNTYVQCSTDAGKSFSTLAALDLGEGGTTHSHAVGALGHGGHAAVVWSSGQSISGQLLLATRPDAKSPFGAPVAIPTYVIPGAAQGAPGVTPTLAYDDNGVLWLAYLPYISFDDRIAVDKSCDDGKTWSGAVLVNGPEKYIHDMRWPSFAMITGATPRIVANAMDHFAIFSLAP